MGVRCAVSETGDWNGSSVKGKMWGERLLRESESLLSTRGISAPLSFNPYNSEIGMLSFYR